MSKLDTEKLIEQLRQLPQLEPPSDLVSGVMEALQAEERSWWQKLHGYLMTSHHVTFRPLPLLVGSACMVIAFGLGMLTGLERAEMSPSPDRMTIVDKALQDVDASFLVGRSLMVAGYQKEALPLLQNASMLAPDQPEYAYWEGLCFLANGMPDKERSSYMRGIDASPDAVPLLLNLGHSFLEHRELDAALTQYEKVLAIVPEERAALYNRGLVFNLSQNPQNEKEAWKTYLKNYRVGRKSLRAVEHLNNLDDFTYRAYRLGQNQIVLNQSSMLNLDTVDGREEDVGILVQSLREAPNLSIDIVCFFENDEQAARKKAIQLKKNIVAMLGEQAKTRVRLSWFGEKEFVQTENGVHELSESFLIFGRYDNIQRKETKI